MMRLHIVIWLALTLVACSPKMTGRFATPEDILNTPAVKDEKHKLSLCYDPLSYVEHPELIRTKFIRVNIHFMNSTDGRYNMPESETATFVRDWLYATNSNLENNMKMFLPHGNNTPVIPIPYRYVLSPDPKVPGDDGIYYHVDDTLCYVVKTGRERNISDRRVIDKYAVRDDSVLNIFVQTHQLDSISSPTYKPDGSGISLGSSVKLFGKWHLKPNVWDNRGVFNHEIGHSLGLAHTWGGHDGCDDTPAHPNCWNKTNTPPCDSLLSNNMMDYNAHMAALTPCQIGKILLNMNREGAVQRNILEPRWCQLDTAANVIVEDSMRWNGSLDLEGHLILKENAILEIACRVSLPYDATITIYPGAQLRILKTGRMHNACGDRWQGIILKEKDGRIGRIEVIEGGKIEDTLHPYITPQS